MNTLLNEAIVKLKLSNSDYNPNAIGQLLEFKTKGIEFSQEALATFQK